MALSRVPATLQAAPWPSSIAAPSGSTAAHLLAWAERLISTTTAVEPREALVCI